MADMYLHLKYDDYKTLERQMRSFAETSHTSTPPGFYHKSIRLKVGDDLTIEFHGPNVRGAETDGG